MAVLTKYTCDLCGAESTGSAMTTVAISNRSRAVIDGTVDVGPECLHRPVADVITRIAGPAPDAVPA